MQTAVSLVAAGIGVSLVPEAVQSLPRTGVTYRPLTDPPVTELTIVYRHDHPSAVLRPSWRSSKRRPPGPSDQIIVRGGRDRHSLARYSGRGRRSHTCVCPAVVRPGPLHARPRRGCMAGVAADAVLILQFPVTHHPDVPVRDRLFHPLAGERLCDADAVGGDVLVALVAEPASPACRVRGARGPATGRA